jgi:AcrR family transcriptional regulator
MEEVAKRGRGRPVTTDPGAVGLTALRLFMEKGIDNVTMDDVAEAAGISRSNLFRIFASKSAVVWGGVHQFNVELAKKLEANPETDIVRLRLKLIASSPEIYGWGHGQLEEARSVIEKKVSELTDDPMRPRVLSSALISVSMAILVWWAETDDPRTPSEVLDAGFSDFEAVFS